MADLGQVRIRALFNETDIGQVKPGQTATVTVDAYPERRFTGVVEKIEPQAVVQQNVTMFPVLVTLQNLEGLLKPGMNGETSVLVDQRTNVLAVPNDAVRNTREAAATAPMLGLDADSVRSAIQTQMAALGGGRGGRGQGGEPAAAPLTQASRGDVALGPQQAGAPAAQGAPQTAAAGQGGGGQSFGGGQGGFQLPEVTDKECDAVTAAMKKKPAEQAKLDSLRQQMMSGAIDRDAMRAETQKIYAAMGVDPRVATACRRRAFQGGGAGGTGGGFQTAGGGARRRPALVFVKNAGKFEPRVVLTGASNFDYTEIISGVKEGEQVAMLAAAALQAQRQMNNDRLRQQTGVPGMQQQGPGGAGGPGGGRAGGGGGGGGGGGRAGGGGR
jgi:HlyD family secretion protein